MNFLLHLSRIRAALISATPIQTFRKRDARQKKVLVFPSQPITWEPGTYPWAAKKRAQQRRWSAAYNSKVKAARLEQAG